MPHARWSAERGARALTLVHAVALVVTAALVIGGRLRGSHPSVLEDVFGALNIPVSRSVFSIVVLGLVTRALLARKRIALYAVALLQILGAYYSVLSLVWDRVGTAPWRQAARATDLSDATNLNNIVAVVAAPLVLWWLWRVRAWFPARLVPGSFRRAIATAALGGAAAIALAAALIWQQVGAADLPRRVYAAIHEAAGDSDPFTGQLLVGVGSWTIHLLSVILSVTLVAAVVVFQRSARATTSWSGERELAIRRLLGRYGENDSLGYFATRRDKASVFASDGQACVTYRVIAGVSLASADPIGRPASWPSAIAAWKQEARTYGWVPAVLSASEAGARAYAGAGLRAMGMGDEAILHPDLFDLRSTALTPVRHAVRRCRRAGIVIALRRQGQIGADELAETASKALEWIGAEPERGFSMALNRPEDPADPQALIVTARGREGELLGLLGFVPWGRSGVSLDVMRRSPGAPNGITEAMVAALLSGSGSLGIRRVSLNFCMFRSVYADAERLGSGPLNRINYSVLGFLDRFWQFERLYRSNEKYHPEWVPRFLCFDDPVSLIPIAVAAANAEGFLRLRPRFFGIGMPQGRLTDDEVALARAVPDDPESLPVVRRNDQGAARVAKLDRLRASGRDPYPVGGSNPQRADEDTLTGRVVAVRDHGGVVFADVDVDGARYQALLEVSRCAARDFARLVDGGDVIHLSGVWGRSRNGSRVLCVRDWTVLAKSLHAIPFGHFTDPQARIRHRSLDLIVNPDTVAVLRRRTAVIKALRQRLDGEGFTEVETPILQSVHGGASARPFTTHINAYHADLSLRIAPELYLKRLVVGGFGPTYEIGRNFRNEGADATHNPEFTSLEAYLPGADYTDMRHLAQRLVTDAALAVHGSLLVPHPAHGDIDLSGDWPVVKVLDAVSAAVGHQITLATDVDALVGIARAHDVPLRPGLGPGGLVEELYGELVEPRTLRPTFFSDFPEETSPLTRPHRTEPGLVERWDLVIAGMELGTAYSELTDPVEQRRRLTAQSWRAAHGDPEAMRIDEAFLAALELGMPPCGGLGLGVDRLVMLLTGAPIRGVLSFPFVKP